VKRALIWLAAAAGLLAVLALTLIAFGLPVGDSLRLLTDGAFGDKFGVARTLVKTSPLLLCGLGMVVAWRAGMYNIGGEGQYVMGALLAASVFKAAPALPGPLLNVVLVLACAAGGAGFAWLAGWLYVKRGVQVVISTILLNFIAIQLLAWAVDGPLKRAKGDLPQTDALPDAAMFLKFDRQLDLHAGVFIGVIAAIALTVYLFRTRGGFQLRLVGESPTAARANRYNAPKAQLTAMAISGALCGLAASSEYLGVTGVLDTGFAQNWGFLGIPAALLGGVHPIGAVFSSLYFGALFAGSENLARYTASGQTIIYVMQAVAVLGFVGAKAWAERRAAAMETPE